MSEQVHFLICTQTQYDNLINQNNVDNYTFYYLTDSSLLYLGKIKLSSTITDISDIHYDNAGAHNAIYRGKYLGDSVTSAQWATIKAGTFEDLYIGDYWTIDNINYRIAAFDYWYRDGDTACADHHAVVVPDRAFYTATMNDSGTAEGGYIGSTMYTTNLEDAKTTFNNAFGSDHILSHRSYFTNAVTNGYPSGGDWVDSAVDLMTETMVYGCPIKKQMPYGGTSIHNHTSEKSQLPLFRFRHDLICIRATYWLRDIASANNYCYVSENGNASDVSASNVRGVRPAVAIYQS